MQLPFTTEQFLDIFRDYNLAVFPMQIVLYFLAIIAILMSMIRYRRSNMIIILVLSLLWLWMGIVYHLIFFTAINKAAWLFGILYITEALLFLYFGIYKKRLSFRFRMDIYGWTGMILLLFALIIYPLLGLALDHVYPAAPTFGLPCPTTIFTFALLLWTDKKFPLVILVIPFLWSIVGFSAALTLGIHEDLGLLVAGVLATVLILIKRRRRLLTY